jgi:C-terminal processing protease CtpA/Prc
MHIESGPASAAAGAASVTTVRVLGFSAGAQKGQAEASGKVSPGDLISKINGESFIGKTDKDVLAVLTSAPRPLEITVSKSICLSLFICLI